MSISKNVIIETQKFIEENTNILSQLPVNIELLVENTGITIMPFPFPQHISGVLAIQKDKAAVIGVTTSASIFKRRFILAHQMGHYKLHKHLSLVFADNLYYRKKAEGYISKEQKIENEANYFAENILMPEVLVKEKLKGVNSDLYDDSTIAALANEFRVTSFVMFRRLLNLKLI